MRHRTLWPILRDRAAPEMLFEFQPLPHRLLKDHNHLLPTSLPAPPPSVPVCAVAISQLAQTPATMAFAQTMTAKPFLGASVARAPAAAGRSVARAPVVVRAERQMW